jgi:hypothetical protein
MAATSSPERQAEIFRRQADYCETRSPFYAALCRRLAVDPRLAAIAPDLRWDLPLRILGGLHYLVLGGEGTWDGVDALIDTRAEFLARFAAEQPVQTNEVARAYALTRGLAATGRTRIDLLELGTAGGLLLYPDRYCDAPFEVVRRRGIDMHPIDVTTEEGARLLEAFVWPDQTDRIERLRAAIEIVRRDPPELIEGDYVDLVSELVGEDTVVMSCVTTMYLEDDRYAELVERLGRATWLSLERPRDARDYDGVQLVLNGRVLEEHVDYHG